MPKINQEEYELLKSLDDKWKWIVRDKGAKRVDIYDELPRKSYFKDWWLVDDWCSKRKKLQSNLFQFIQWEDKEPYEIAELIREYENSAEHISHVVRNKVEALANAWGEVFKTPYESEETEVKDKKRLQDSITRVMQDLFSTPEPNYFDFEKTNKRMRELIDQLDEPEVLSPEWIDENSQTYQWHESMVPASKLQNLIVPKQGITGEQFVNYAMDNDLVVFEKEALEDRDKNIIEKYTKNKVVTEKPVIPQFVADYIEKQKKFGYSFLLAYEIISDSNKRHEADEKLADYIQKNQDDFVRAWYGYEIEQEPKYYAKIKGWENVTTGSERFNWVYFKEKDTVGVSKAIENKYQAVSFTKDEWENLGINDDNADFVEVEELEE